jgi:hypothetical protein
MEEDHDFEHSPLSGSFSRDSETVDVEIYCYAGTQVAAPLGWRRSRRIRKPTLLLPRWSRQTAWQLSRVSFRSFSTDPVRRIAVEALKAMGCLE